MPLRSISLISLIAFAVFTVIFLDLTRICIAQVRIQVGDPELDDPIEQPESNTQVSRGEPSPAQNSRVANKVAVFSGIDKITGRTATFHVHIDKTVQFGALQVTPRVCYSEEESQNPKADTFVEVDEITLDRRIRRIFTGWMFADSPGLNAVDHPVYDVWLKACRMNSDVPPPTSSSN